MKGLKTMKTTFKRGLLGFVLGFVVLFAARLLYGYAIYSEVPQGLVLLQDGDDFSAAIATSLGGRDTLWASPKNYATQKMKTGSAVIDQKYEKVALLTARTRDFDGDELNLREAVKRHDALIQLEQNWGIAGHRRLNIAIGVHPEKYDSLLADVRKVGNAESSKVDKVDKTNEYKELNASKVSLEKTRDSLVALKNKAGKIDEFVALENRILEIEKEIQ
ncbi:MAG TPA: DUF4349 domain-containing protein [Blastocatellia bacterium]|nr:DUF4349 domain-containing protein [Blastocatellia bacterium]